MSVAVRRYIDTLIIITFPYTCIGSSIPTSLFIFLMFFVLVIIKVHLYIGDTSNSSHSLQPSALYVVQHCYSMLHLARK